MATITIQLTNPALSGDPTTIYQNVAASLHVVLTNETSAAISFTTNSEIIVYLPYFFSTSEVAAMTIGEISPDDWDFAYDSGLTALKLTAKKRGSWASGAELSFDIDSVVASAAPTSDAVELQFQDFSGQNIPLSVSATLNLQEKPEPGSASLRDTLSVEMEYGGIVYISNPQNPLSNTLYLNFKNTGTDPLYSGEDKWRGDPKVEVYFVYGTTSGALAPATKPNSGDVGSAWGISGKIFTDQTEGWTIANPDVSGQANSPVWTLKPNGTNIPIIGTGDQANITFAFEDIVSLTPAGATQMYVSFSGFMKDEQTVYDDTTFVVPISKTDLQNPGAIGIYCLDAQIEIQDAAEQVPIPLTWSMLGVGSVKLSFYVPGVTIPEVKYSYGATHPVLNYDQQSPEISGITSTETLIVYLWAYSDDNWQQQLNKIETSVPLIFPPRIDAFTIKVIDTAPPNSYSFQLDWEIAGETSFEIVADDGRGSPVVLPVPQSATTYVVHPTAPETTYTLNVYGNESVVEPENA
ncbi:MAG: hypothetical protein AAF998_13685 [Bacteroidota bacterium]